jgi:hypothetical protein
MTTSDTELLDLPGARCRLYWDAPHWDGRRTVAVGGFACESTIAGADLLREARRRARARGFAAVVGPMDGDTWHRYRVVTSSDGSKPFLLEPVSGPFDHDAFVAASFEPVSRYVSARAKLDDAIGEPAPPTRGVTIAPWDGRDTDGLLRRLFEMSLSTFQRNAFYKPIALESFLQLYAPVLPLIDPELVLFARNADGRIVGFLFGLDNRAPGAERAAILKTYASGMPGCGRLLADTFHRRARDRGFTHVIHALMHEDNASRQRSRQHRAEVFRKYALMGAFIGEDGP